MLLMKNPQFLPNQPDILPSEAIHCISSIMNQCNKEDCLDSPKGDKFLNIKNVKDLTGNDTSASGRKWVVKGV